MILRSGMRFLWRSMIYKVDKPIDKVAVAKKRMAKVARKKEAKLRREGKLDSIPKLDSKAMALNYKILRNVLKGKDIFKLVKRSKPKYNIPKIVRGKLEGSIFSQRLIDKTSFRTVRSKGTKGNVSINLGKVANKWSYKFPTGGVNKMTYRDRRIRRVRRLELVEVYDKVKEGSGLKVSVSKTVRRQGGYTKLGSKSNIFIKSRFDGEVRDEGRGLWGIMEGMLMKNGKKRLIENVIQRVRVKLRKKFGRSLNLDNFLERAVGNVLVRIGLGKRRVGGKYRLIPVSILKYKAIRQGCKRIKKGIEGRTERTVEERVMNELVDAYNNVGRSVRLLNERRRLIEESKSWLKLIR